MESLLNIEPLSVDKTGMERNALAGDVAVVTGGGSNIGLATARSLAWLGARVVIAEIKPQTGAAAAELINRENKQGTALFVETDVSNRDSINMMAKQALETFGKVDILVHSAMIMGANVYPLDTPVDNLDRIYAVSTRGMLLGIQAFVPGMKERHHGVVTYLASAFRYPRAGMNYCAVKGATTSIVMSLAAELGDVKDSGVAAFTLVPGWTGRPRPEQSQARQQAASQSRQRVSFAGVNIGYEGQMPPEDLGAALSYSIVHASEIHGSGITAGQVQRHMGWPFPKPDLVPKRDFDRFREAVEVRMFGYIGQGFTKPGDQMVSINRSDAPVGEQTLNFVELMEGVTNE